MNLTLAFHASYRTFEWIVEIPQYLTGEQTNTRSLNFSGVWNAAVDFLIIQRFTVELSSIFIQFHPDDTCMSIDDFLHAGGFDEAIEPPEEALQELRLRVFEAQGATEQYAQQLVSIQKHPMSPRLGWKMSLRLGMPSQAEGNEPHTKVSQALSGEDHPLKCRDITVCVTFGDARLMQQFLKSLAESVSELNLNIHLVACCFRLDHQEVRQAVQFAGSFAKSAVVLQESWGHGQGKEGALGPWYVNASVQHGVSWGRCVLHRAAALHAPTEAMWVVDDDVVFTEGAVIRALHALELMKIEGRKVGVGAVLGDAPIPPSYMVRTQTVDFFYAQFLQSSDQTASPPQDLMFHDVHHDLSTESSHHIEFPLGIDRAQRYHKFNNGVLHGNSLTRSVHGEWKERTHLLPRGGNTLVLGTEPLLQYPNMAPNLGGIMCRRGDTLWTKRIEAERPEWIGNANVALIQRRQDDFQFGSRDGVRGDILGSMLARWHNRPEMGVDEFIRSAQEREARLISNLKRTLVLLGMMHVEEVHQRPLHTLLEELEHTPWPQNLAEDVVQFMKAYPLDALKFQQAQGV